MIRVLIVDDIKILCQGLEVTLKKDNEIEVIGMVHNGKAAVEFCQRQLPDVVLMDMRMPDYDGAYATQMIKKDYPQVKILVLTTFDDEKTIKDALASGADGYILKEMEDDMIISSVKSTYHGVKVLGNTVFSVIKNASGGFEKRKEISNISDRDRDILRYVSKGYNNKEIADKLYLAEGTVRNGISRLLEKLQLKDRTQLAIFALKNGIE